MTRDEAKTVIRNQVAIEAYSRGSELQLRYDGKDWEDFDHTFTPDFKNSKWEWRIKPVPREVFISSFALPGDSGVWYTGDAGMLYPRKFREVLE